ncbi:MAG: ATP-dependent Clp protease proteolytic subunit [Coriobacteriia bacterium]|jgi:ATP-dependent Clp endopeptidase proteolytic subunit ClpP|nr:ATP-dependent Clp protease proteolytic subunit [Coriobacteriia bacterium]
MAETKTRDGGEPTAAERKALRAADISVAQSLALCNQQEALEHKAQTELLELQLERERRKDEFDLSQDYHFGHVVFATPVDDDTALALASTLRRVARMRPNQPVVIDLTTPGGSITHGFAAYDEILRLRGEGIKVTIRVRGEAASMGAILLQAADVRECGPNSRIMLHRAAFGVVGSTHEVEDSLDEARAMEANIYRLLGERTNQTAAWWKKRLAQRKDVWFSAEEALKVGLIDEIR